MIRRANITVNKAMATFNGQMSNSKPSKKAGKAKEIIADDKLLPVSNEIAIPTSTKNKLNDHGMKHIAAFIEGDGDILSNVQLGEDSPLYLLNAIKADFDESSYENRVYVPVNGTLPEIPNGKLYVTVVNYSFGDKPVGAIKFDLAVQDLFGNNNEEFEVTALPQTKSGRIAIISTKSINGVMTPFVSQARAVDTEFKYVKFNTTDAALTVHILTPSESVAVIEQLL